jgi:hypothetical protein
VLGAHGNGGAHQLAGPRITVDGQVQRFVMQLREANLPPSST